VSLVCDCPPDCMQGRGGDSEDPTHAAMVPDGVPAERSRAVTPDCTLKGGGGMKATTHSVPDRLSTVDRLASSLRTNRLVKSQRMASCQGRDEDHHTGSC